MAGKACLFFADQRRLQCTSGFNQLNTKMPTENAVGLPVQSQVRGACLLPPWGMVFNQRGFVFFFPEIGWKLAFRG